MKTYISLTKTIVTNILILVLVNMNAIAYGSSKTNLPNDGSNIYISEFVQIGGIEQYILICGNSIHNPVLLVLHGGPGTPETPLFRQFNRELEEHFTMVYWEQRCAGKSYHKNIPDSSLTLDQFVEDTHELTQYLRSKFNQNKIVLMGHSWGSYLGMHVIDKYPEDYVAYIGISQVANQPESEKISYEYVLNHANEIEDKNALKELTAIGEFSQDNVFEKGVIDWLMTERKYVKKYGGASADPAFMKKIYKAILQNKDYSFGDKIRFLKGEKQSLNALFPTLLSSNLTATITEVEIPVYIFHGLHDYQTCYSVTEQYYNQLKAPEKELYVFEHAAHMLPYEASAEFNNIMGGEVLNNIQQYLVSN